MTFVWAYSCFPCFISADSKYIIILDVRNNVPIYSPAFEKLKDHFLGTFELKDNCFQERCGIEVLADGSVIICVKPVKNVTMKKQAYLATGVARAVCVDADTQTDAPNEVIYSGEASYDGLAEPAEMDDVYGDEPFDEIHDEDDTVLDDAGGHVPSDVHPGEIEEAVGGQVPSDDVTEVVDLAADIKRLLKDRLMSKTKKHCMLHSPPCMGCEGCIAKSLQKRHYKCAFARLSAKYEHVVTMDQLTLIDVNNTVGLGGYKYAIIFCKVKEDYWQFIPLKRLGATEAEVHFRQFCLACNCTRMVSWCTVMHTVHWYESVIPLEHPRGIHILGVPRLTP